MEGMIKNMALRQIREVGDDILRKKSRPVEVVDERTKQLIDDMYETLKASEDGIGLAAPQVGVLKRVIVKSKGEQVCREGCLSVPGVLGDVIRPKEVVVEALNENGQKIKIKAQDLLAIVLCHEIDHLDGILFTDKATELFDNTDEEEG